MFKETIEIVQFPWVQLCNLDLAGLQIVLIYVNASVMRMIQLCHNLLDLNLLHLHKLLLLFYVSLAILGWMHQSPSSFSYNLIFVAKKINWLFLHLKKNMFTVDF